MEEQVFGASRADEPESLFRQLLDSAFGHLCVSRSDCLDRRRPAYDGGRVAVR